MLVVFLLSLAFSALVGYIIDEGRGALWGLFLGPIGWIIAAILKGKAKTTPDRLSNAAYSSGSVFSVTDVQRAPPTVESEDQRKWKVLKEVDAEIFAASEKVSQLDPSLDDILASKYLTLNDKQYLKNLTDSIIQIHSEKLTEARSLELQRSEEVLQSGRDQKAKYEGRLLAGSIDPESGKRVANIEIYAGSWKGWKGGIRITLEDGTNVLFYKAVRRAFPPGDDSWK